jgi:hypothetical protein
MTARHSLQVWLLGALVVPALGRPIDPAIDDGPGPFCYFSRPSTVLGVADGAEGTQVTAEGWLWTGNAELMFFYGPQLKPLRQRIHILQDGCLPIVSYAVREQNLRYTVTMFGTTLDGRPEGNLINFVRVTLKNEGGEPAEAIVAAAVRALGPHCCTAMRKLFSFANATYRLGPFYALRDEQVLFLFPTEPRPQRLIVPDRPDSGPIKAREEFIAPEVPVCMVRYALRLQPSATAALDFKMPYEPVPASDEQTLRALREANFDSYLERTAHWWRTYLAQGMQIELPEAKVVDTYRASIMYDSIARDKVGDEYVAKVNEFQYDAFWVRDGTYIVAAFDYAGRHDWAAQALEHFFAWQQSDGIIYQPPQLDGWGQALFAFGQHWRLSGDQAWARRVYPRLARAVRGIFARTAQDPLGLVPVAPPYDNEAIFGHYTGHSLWLLIGLRDVIALAQALGERADAEEFATWYRQYRANFLRVLDKVTAKTGGYLPPGLDAEDGCDWGNLLLLYPRGGVPARGNFDPDDPRVTATVNTVREKKYAEGIMTYGRGLRPGTLHHYLTMKVTHNLVAQNRQQEALEDFYAILAHTSSTHAGYECGIVPWDNRDPGGNFPPHGWFAAQYIGLLRNMLVREWGEDLHLLSVLSPAWTRPGARVAVRGAPTDFGVLSLEAHMEPGGMKVRLAAQWRRPPRRLVLHLPWFVQGLAAQAEGQAVPVQPVPYGQGQQVELEPRTQQVAVRWRVRAQPGLSYASAVEEWKRENRRHFAAFVRSGGRPEPLWGEGSLPLCRSERQERWAQMEAQHGIAVGCPATASKSDPGHPPEGAVDGMANREVHWAATPYPQWWQVDLGSVRALERVRVVTYWDDGDLRRFYRYRVLLSADGEHWETVADCSTNQEPAGPAGREHRFPPHKARWVRVEMLYNSANAGVHLAEVMVFPAVEAPVAEAPAQWQAAWTAEEQTGHQRADMPQWGFVGAQRLILQADKIRHSGDRVRLIFCGADQQGIAIGDVSLAQTDPQEPMDILPPTRVPISFGGASSVELPAGGSVASDWIRFPLVPGRNYTVTFSVLRTGGTKLWADPHTRRYETTEPGAALLARWSRIPISETYNLYFLARVEVPR